MLNRNYRVGLDLGIGSVGWAVISHQNHEQAHIEDFGSRIFDSGELKGKSRKSQERRGFRGVRRLVRRRYWRKERLKNYFLKLHLFSRQEIEEACTFEKEDIFLLKVRALNQDIGLNALLRVLIHACNHRGYRDFYEDDADALEEGEDIKESAINKKAAQNFDKAFLASACRTVSEYLLKMYQDATKRLNFRNHDYRSGEERLLIRRRYIKAEVHQILEQQSKYHRQITSVVMDTIESIIFVQRNFEDGPGNKNDMHRRYTGFLDKLGNCPFYPELRRGFRNTPLADLYAIINALSQYRYINMSGEPFFPPEAAKEIVIATLQDASMTFSAAKKIMEKYRIRIFKSPGLETSKVQQANKYLGAMKKAADEAGENWLELLGNNWEKLLDQQEFDAANPSLLHQVGEVLAKYKTPKYRQNELKKVIGNQKFCQILIGKAFSGASACSYKYMWEAVQAFLRGDTYGNWQAAKNKELAGHCIDKPQAILTPGRLMKDEDVCDNPVVLRAINETRKVINQLVRIYGAPECINVEVARDLGRSFLERDLLDKRNHQNESKRKKAKEVIAGLLQCTVDDVRGVQLDKYLLYQEQGGKCLYSGEELDLLSVLRDAHVCEVDHIVPYSLILDNTLQNKALVLAGENQQKRQRTPLMYLAGVRRENFVARINAMYTRKENALSQKKYQYLMMPSLYGDEAEEILDTWKSRNINDTRYITKYVLNYLKHNLKFAGESKVYAIRGGLTAKFRRVWLNEKTWGSEEKNRENYLNHAADAVVLANLTPAYIEIGSDNMRLQQIFRQHHRQISDEYIEYMDSAVRKMKKYYGFSEAYTRSLLEHHERVPALVAALREEVDIRFNNTDNEDIFMTRVREFYGEHSEFVIPPHLPLVSHKLEHRNRGAIADSNPVKVRKIDNVAHKIIRKNINLLKATDFGKIYTNDKQLKAVLKDIFQGKAGNYTIEKYLKEQGLKEFHVPSGAVVHKVSIDSGVYSNFYKKEIDSQNYSMLGMLKYYCIEIYKNEQGENSCWGIRYVDLIHRNKKLYLKRKKLPTDYKQHVMYLFKGDYIEFINEDGTMYFKGFYQAAKGILQRKITIKSLNFDFKKEENKYIKKEGTIKKYSIDILGHKGGEIKCSAPLLFIPENE